MDTNACLKNLTGCLASVGLKLCDAGQDICLGHGICITSSRFNLPPVCICDSCYYGNTCEKEVFSRNLWVTGQPVQKLEILTGFKFFIFFYGAVRLINYFLCLQTYLSSHKIRITNIGVHLIFNSIISVLYSLEELISSIFALLTAQLPEHYWRATCLVNQKFVSISLSYIWGWSVFFIAFERMLVECYRYSLFDSRKRSFIILTLITLICPLTTLPGIFTLKNLPTNELSPLTNAFQTALGCVNYTPLGYTIFKVILSLHGYGSLLSYILLYIIVFAHLVRHRRRIAPNHTTLQNIRVILHNHRDFFIPLLVPILCLTPMLIINETMTCFKASKLKSLPILILIFGSVFGLLPTSFSFFFYIYPANVYMIAFWNHSPVGRCLRKLKRQIIKMNRQFRNTLPVPAPAPQQP